MSFDQEQQRDSAQSAGKTDIDKGATTDDSGQAAQSQAEELAEAERQAQAKQDWEKLLGEKIGGKLYELLREHASYADLLGYAKDGSKSVADALGKLAKPTKKGAAGGVMDTQPEADAANKVLSEVLAPALKAALDKWLESEKGKRFLLAINHWVEENPAAVTAILGTAAIGAAVAVYLSNMDVPEFSKTFDLGKHFKVGAGIDLGKIQELSVQAAKLSVEYTTKGLSATIKASHDVEKDTTLLEGEIKGDTKIGDTAVSASGKVSHTTVGDKDGVLKAEAKLAVGDALEVSGTHGPKGNAASGTLKGGTQIGRVKADGTGTAQIDEAGRLTLTADGGLSGVLGDMPASARAKLISASGGGKDDSLQIQGNVAFGEKGEQTTAAGTYDPNTGAFTFNVGRQFSDGKGKHTTGVARDKDGNVTSTEGLTYTDKEAGTALAYSHSDGQKGATDELSLSQTDVGGSGLDFSTKIKDAPGKKDDSFSLGLGMTLGAFKNELDLQMKDSASSLNLSTEGTIGKNVTVGASGRYNLDTNHLDTFSTKFGFRDPAAFETFTLEYKGQWMKENEQYAHSADLLLEHSFGKLDLRLKGGAAFQGGDLTGANVDVLGAYPVTDNGSVLLGGGYDYTTQGGQGAGQPYVQAGWQFKKQKFGVVGRYNIDDKTGDNQFSLGIVIPLGR